MGEIIFSLFLGLILVITGLVLAINLTKEIKQNLKG